MHYHPKCTFVELKVVFCNYYRKVQTNEHVSMALRVIKQTAEVYYECILKLTNYLHHKINDNFFLKHFFQAKLVPYLPLTITRMK